MNETAIDHGTQTDIDYLVYSQRESDRLAVVGYVLLGTSAALLMLPNELSTSGGKLGLFVIQYVLAFIYFFTLTRSSEYSFTKGWQSKSVGKTLILLVLFTTSGFGLNKLLPIFGETPPWTTVVTVVVCLNFVTIHFVDRLPKWCNRLQAFILGIGIIYLLYCSFYFAPTYLLGVVATILFLIGLHVFLAPVLLVTSVTSVLKQLKRRVSVLWVVAGMIVALFYTLGFVAEWTRRVHEIEVNTNQMAVTDKSDLPIWVRIAQGLRSDWITERMLNGNNSYRTVEKSSLDTIMPFNTDGIHDPFVVVSTFFGKVNLSYHDRELAWNALTTTRHRSEPRIWDGDQLSTAYVVSDIDIYPSFGLSYTEVVLNIRNSSGSAWNAEEAVYTFSLPEGGVVTSLSLWMEGREEKGILASKQSASLAYNSIVSKRRDPSIVQWQEGNRVTVRVFPCTPKEERKVKIGISAPLALVNGRWEYRAINFEGPISTDAKETIRVRVNDQEKGELPTQFKLTDHDDYLAQGDYNPNFVWSAPAKRIEANKLFHANGVGYRIEEASRSYMSNHFDLVYLDVNKHWTTDELKVAFQMSERIPAYMHDGKKFVRISDFASLEDLSKRNFSMFPFYEITDPGKALVVTKGDSHSPFLEDLTGSPFSDQLTKFFSQQSKAFVYNLGDEAATYIKSLRQFRVLHFSSGTIDQLGAALEKDSFLVWNEDSQSVLLPNSGLRISKVENLPGSSAAPDHLARLFEYNDILKKASHHYFAKDFVDQQLVDQAARANVVSPVSSLVVLESQEDYDRFDIKATQDGLGNASIEGEGAVPEPHEWALMILMGLLLVYLRFGHRFAVSRR